MNVHIIIPARLGSTRLKNKMLKKILGKTLIEHMCERALKLNFKNLVVATDSKEIIETVAKYNINTYFSSKKFNNGTERIRDYLIKKNISGNDIIINIQGDELNFSLVTVRKMISFLKKNRSYEIITPIYRAPSPSVFNDPNNVKVTINSKLDAISFTRSQVPYKSYKESYIHIGIYGYKASIIKKYNTLKKCYYESVENLEQLRFVYNMIPIKCICVKNNHSFSINSKKDLISAERFFK